MVRKNRKPKDYTFSTFADEEYDDENPGVITDADGTRRTTRPGEVQEVFVGDALLAAQAAHPELRDQDEDEPDNRQRTSSLAHTADLTAPEAGSEPANRQRTSSLAHTADLTAPATGSRGTTTTSPSSSRDPRKPKRIPWKPTPSTNDESTSPTPAEMAAIQKKYTYSEAVRLINVPLVATTDDEFRNELADFWDNWRTLNIKTEGSTPKAGTCEWRKYKIVNVLLARYRKFCGGIIKQQLAAQQTQTVIVNVTTTSEQTSSSTSAVGPPAQQPLTSTEATTTVTSTTTVTTTTASTTTDDATDSPTAPDTTTEALPQLELDPHEMEVLHEGNILQDMDPEAVARIQSYLLTDNPDADNIQMEPQHINFAADLLQRVTGTPSLVYHENMAINAVRLYRLNAALMDRMARTDDPSSAQRTTIENLRQHIHTVLPPSATIAAPAARADRGDQEQQPAERSVADRLAHTADGQSGDAPTDRPDHTAGDHPQGVAQVVPAVPPPAPIQHRSISRSPMDEDKRDEEPKKVASQTKDIRHRSSSMFQLLMMDKDTTTPWPEYFHFKQGAERWVSNCELAYHYLFDRLFGPLRFRPTWLQTTNVHVDLRISINNEMLGRASDMFNELRHDIYRQYGLRRIRAELARETIYWEPFASSSNCDSTRHGRLLLGQTIVFAEEPIYHAFSPMLRVEMIAIRDGNRAAIRAELFNCFPGDNVNRVVFWLGRNFLVDGNHDDFDKLVQEVCHVYAKYFGNVEVFVILPPYARTQRAEWMSQDLRLLVEQEQDIPPYARVALYTSDIQLYEHDHRLGVSSPWPSALGTSEDGRYLTGYTIEGRKKYLMEEHGLDLWRNYPRVSSKAAHHLIDYASTPIPDSAHVDVDYTSAPPTRPDSPVFHRRIDQCPGRYL
ncbi:hypothetical protein AAVH_31799 [Aphelenchoides avenae]|nr:hypothetical protein AAVH_31799 [Aphelenchus avenae]